MLPFYSSGLTPKEQGEIEEIKPEELTEELAKVKCLGPRGYCSRLGRRGHWAAFAHGPSTHLLPLTHLPGDSKLHRDGEFLEKVQQSETGTTEPPTQTCPVVRNQWEVAGDAQAVLRWHLSE